MAPSYKITTDVWGEAFDFSEYIMSKPEFQGHGYVIVASQYSRDDCYGYIYVKNIYYMKTNKNSGDGGYILMFQTRQGK